MTTETMTAAQPTVLVSDAIARLPHGALGSLEGVDHAVLWRDETSMAGVMTIAPGHHLGRHTHRRHHHHIWVLDGRATIVDREVGPGSYVHVPSGVEHDLHASTAEPCRVLYLYIRYEPEGDQVHILD